MSARSTRNESKSSRSRTDWARLREPGDRRIDYADIPDTYRGLEVVACGPWSQGPVLLQALGFLEGVDLRALGHDTPAYVHTVTEALKLAFADREGWYGDPDFVDVPIAELVSRPTRPAAAR